MINYYERYKLLDSFIRCEDRIFNLAKNTPVSIRLLLESISVELPNDSKMFKSNDTIIISTDNIVGKEYILQDNKEYTVILLPENIRSDDYNIVDKIKALFRVLNESNKTESMYDLQVSLQPLLMTVTILSDMYEPFDDLAKVMYDNLLVDIKINSKKEDVLEMMSYINSNTSDEKFKTDLFSNGSILTVISKDTAAQIVRSYSTFNK